MYGRIDEWPELPRHDLGALPVTCPCCITYAAGKLEGIEAAATEMEAHGWQQQARRIRALLPIEARAETGEWKLWNVRVETLQDVLSGFKSKRSKGYDIPDYVEAELRNAISYAIERRDHEKGGGT
jgi:hypothetical protein